VSDWHKATARKVASPVANGVRADIGPNSPKWSKMTHSGHELLEIAALQTGLFAPFR